MTTKQKLFLSIVCVVVLGGGISALVPNGSTWIAIGMVAVVLSMIWTGQEQKLLKALASGFVAIIAWLFFSAWDPTSDTMAWISARGSMNSPRNNFDPTAKVLTPTAGVVVCGDTPIKPAPLEYRFDPDTGCPIVPTTPELIQELRERQEKPEVSFAATSVPTKAFVNDEGRSGRIVLTPGGKMSVTKDVTFNYTLGQVESRYSGYPLEGCADLFCDGNFIGTQCAPRMLPTPAQSCAEVEYRLTSGAESAVIDFTLSVR